MTFFFFLIPKRCFSNSEIVSTYPAMLAPLIHPKKGKKNYTCLFICMICWLYLSGPKLPPLAILKTQQLTLK